MSKPYLYTRLRDIDINTEDILKNIKVSLDLELNFNMRVCKKKELNATTHLVHAIQMTSIE